ncbi:MAG: hypothetical protein WDZ35_12125 [Crocinitomicaceae bacterium]
MKCIKLKSLTVTINILFLLFFGSCDKTNSKHWTVVKINAQNYITGEPIEDVYCGVYTQKGGILNSGVEELDVSNTENGVYEFGFKAKKNKTYWAEAAIDIDKYYTVQFSNFMNLSNGEVNEFDFELVPEAELRMKITNMNCVNDSDKIVVYLSNIDVPSYNGYSANPDPYYGCFDNTTSYNSIPTGRYAFEWHVTKNSVTEIFYDTLHLQEGDKVTYEILY